MPYKKSIQIVSGMQHAIPISMPALGPESKLTFKLCILNKPFIFEHFETEYFRQLESLRDRKFNLE